MKNRLKKFWLNEDIRQIGTKVGDGMAKLIEARRSTKLPGRAAQVGEINRMQVPNNPEAIQGMMRHLDRPEFQDRLAGPQQGERLALGGPEPQQGPEQARLRGPGADQQVIPLNRVSALVTQGGAGIVWHEVRHLPGQVRQMGKKLFGEFFRTTLNADIDELSVATDMPGSGSNPRDLQKMWSFLLARGRVDDSFNMELFDIDPQAYEVEDAHVVDFGGHRFFLMVESHHGGRHKFRYIYVAPEKGVEMLDRPKLTDQR